MLLASLAAGAAFMGITLGLAELLDYAERSRDARYTAKRADARRRLAEQRSRCAHPSSQVRVLRTRPFDYDSDGAW